MTGPFMTGLRVTLRTMPEFGSPAAVAVQTLAAPAFTALFYLLLSRSGQGQSEAGGAGATLAALVGACAVQTVTLVASTLSEDRYEGTLPHELVAAGTGVRSWAGRFAAMLLVALLGGLASLAATFAATPADAWPGGTPLALLPAALALTAVSCLASLGMGLCIAALSLACTDALSRPTSPATCCPSDAAWSRPRAPCPSPGARWRTRPPSPGRPTRPAPPPRIRRAPWPAPAPASPSAPHGSSPPSRPCACAGPSAAATTPSPASACSQGPAAQTRARPCMSMRFCV